jgi:hypothetical protein
MFKGMKEGKKGGKDEKGMKPTDCLAREARATPAAVLPSVFSPQFIQCKIATAENTDNCNQWGNLSNVKKTTE